MSRILKVIHLEFGAISRANWLFAQIFGAAQDSAVTSCVFPNLTQSELHPLVSVQLTTLLLLLFCVCSVCQLIPGYGMGTCCEQGMKKDEAGSPARKTILTFFQKNRHTMAFLFQKNDVLKMSVSGKYPIFIRFCDRVLVLFTFEDSFWVRTTFGQKC